MAYSELVKDYARIRDYMRQFYVYGFKSRDDYNARSARSYDNERRRIESWLGEYMYFRQNAAGKTVFLSVDSRNIKQNPLFRSFKAKSFTDKDITLHFYILDILSDNTSLTSNEIVEKISDEYLSHFERDYSFDESTIRKKLNEYESLGLLKSEKKGRSVYFSRSSDNIILDSWLNALSFFSEENAVGVVGSFLLDKFDTIPDYFGFKHHYIVHALDSQVMCDLLVLMREHRAGSIIVRNMKNTSERTISVYPMKIYVGTQTGRQYLMLHDYDTKRIAFTRLDSIQKVIPGEVNINHNEFDMSFDETSKKLWGVSIKSGRTTDHIEMAVRIKKNESYILNRLEREKRNGTIEQINNDTWLFKTDVYDASEMLPWIRTFIGRIVSLNCSDPKVTDTFYADLDKMIKLYKGDDEGEGANDF